MLGGIIRALSVNKKVLSLELLDTVIIALGASSVIASLLLRPAMVHLNGSAFSVFLSILYPTGDIVLVAITISLVTLQRRSGRTLILLTGATLFAITDLYFLLKSATTGYTFGQLTDDGWIFGLLLIGESLWHPGGEVEISDRVNSIATTFSLIASSTILAIAALKPNYFPAFVLIPGFATITLAFIRMALALRDARSVSTERELARTDELTGLPNRRRFLAELEILLTKEGTLLLLDLDGFKIVNDKYGHEIGDQLLKQVTTRFTRAIPDNVLLARLGGDEFGVIIYGPATLGTEIALAIRATTSYPFSLSVGEVSIGVSIGSVTSNTGGSNKEELLRRADSAMYEAKRSGNGLVSWGLI
jgi:diguanylate cyclase (GGDEF)-like protein